jgi:hypothetical protein
MGTRGRSFAFFLLAWCFLSNLQAEPVLPGPRPDTLKRSGFDTSFIRDYKHLLTGRFFILYQESKLIYEDRDLGNVVLKPNLVYKPGIAGFYKWFGLGLSYYSPLSLKRADQYGKTRAYDLRINVYSKAFMLESYAQWLKGFYISNLTMPSGELYTNPSMVLISVGAAGYYIMNSSRFSVRAALIQNEQQLKSAGSFLARVALSYGNVTSDSGLIPPQLLRDYHLNSGGRVVKGSYYLAGFAPGYGYTWVFLKNFYVNAYAFLGAGWSFLSGSDSAGARLHASGFGLQFNPRLAMGYNSDKWYIGGSAAMGIWQVSALSDYTLLYDAPQFRLWVGTRFNVSKKKHKK